ncbi:MAG TPA: HlyD family efflux transporter periplasmic adaptor subunit [Thermoanaerobaculia bacterium]|nr:HlyD family efflux transporter periplasmic adaptor subunit [Thermoanaerobaculia bacterium]
MRKLARGWLVLPAAALVLALGAFLPRAGSFGASGDVPVLTVEKQPFVRRVPAPGNLQAVRATPVSVPLGAPGPFRIGWLAPDGTRVKAGEVVIRFDPSAIEKELVGAEDDLRGARLKIGKTEVESLAELRKLERDAEMARIELDNARQFAKKDEMIYSRGEIIESSIDQELVARKEEHVRAAQRTQRKLSGTDLELLGIELRQAEAKIRRARQALQALAVTAPHDGVLILKRDWRGETSRVGDTVWNGQPLAEIPDLSLMEAEVFVLEADAGGLTPGKRATVSLESSPGATHEATIERVDALAKPRLQGSPVQYFAVTLKLAKTDPKVMKPGQRVQATLYLDERKEALLVPRQAVFENEGKRIAYRRKGAGFEPVEVKLGPGSLGRVVIESGLAAGDVLALRDPTRRPEEPEKAPEEGSPSAAPAAPGAAPEP